MKTRQDKRMVKLDSFSPKKPLLDMYYKNKHIHCLVHNHSFWSTFYVHLVKEGSNDFGNRLYFFKPDHGNWTIRSDHGLMPSSMV